MYVILKNEKTIQTDGNSKQVWKYLEEAKTHAENITQNTSDVISVCELKPLFTYNLELVCKDETATEEPPEETTPPEEDTEETDTQEPNITE